MQSMVSLRFFVLSFGLLWLTHCGSTSFQDLLDANLAGLDKSAPTFVYPAGSAPLVGLRQTLVWTAKSGVSKYRLELYEDAALTVTAGSYTASTNSLDITFADGKTYYYRLSVETSAQRTEGALHVLDALYVYCPASVVTCDDTGRTGTKSLPYQTLNGAISRIQQLGVDTMRIAARDTTATGSYTQNVITIPAGKSIYGGYSPDFSVRNTTTYKTLLQNVTSTQVAVLASGITKATIVDGLNIKGIVQSDFSGQRLSFQNSTFDVNASSGAINLNSSSPLFRNNTINVSIVGSGTSGLFLGNTVTANADMMTFQTTGITASRPIVSGNSLYANNTLGSTRNAILIKDTNASAVVMKNFINAGNSNPTCVAIALKTNPTNLLVTGNTIAMSGSCADARPVELNGVAGGTSNAFHNNIIVTNGTLARTIGYEFAGSPTPELTKNLGIDAGSAGTFNKWYVNGATPTTFSTLGTGNLTSGTVASIFVDWDGPDNNLGTIADNDQSLLAASPALNQGITCGVALGTKSHNWGVGSDAADCELRFPGSTFSGGFCTATLLKETMEILDDGIGNDNGICEAGETCLYNPNMGAYWGHGALVDAGCDVSGIISNVTLKKYATNGY